MRLGGCPYHVTVEIQDLSNFSYLGWLDSWDEGYWQEYTLPLGLYWKLFCWSSLMFKPIIPTSCLGIEVLEVFPYQPFYLAWKRGLEVGSRETLRTWGIHDNPWILRDIIIPLIIRVSGLVTNSNQKSSKPKDRRCGSTQVMWHDDEQNIQHRAVSCLFPKYFTSFLFLGGG